MYYALENALSAFVESHNRLAEVWQNLPADVKEKAIAVKYPFEKSLQHYDVRNWADAVLLAVAPAVSKEVELLARTFATELIDEIGVSNVMEVYEWLSCGDGPNEHEFTDANQTMLNAFVKAFGREMRLGDDDLDGEDMTLVDNAWDYARLNKFWVNSIFEEVTKEHPEFENCVNAFEGVEVEKYFIHTKYAENDYGYLQFILQKNGKYFCVVESNSIETENLDELLAFMSDNDLNKP